MNKPKTVPPNTTKAVTPDAFKSKSVVEPVTETTLPDVDVVGETSETEEQTTDGINDTDVADDTNPTLDSDALTSEDTSDPDTGLDSPGATWDDEKGWVPNASSEVN